MEPRCYTIPMRGMPKARPRCIIIGMFARLLTPEKYRKWLKDCANLVKLQKPTLMKGDLIMFADFYLTTRAGVKPDADNLAGGLMDAIEGICYENDRQIIELHSRRIYPAFVDEIKLRLVSPDV